MVITSARFFCIDCITGLNLRLLISLRGINSCSEEPLAARSSRSETIASVAPGGTCWKMANTQRSRRLPARRRSTSPISHAFYIGGFSRSDQWIRAKHFFRRRLCDDDKSVPDRGRATVLRTQDTKLDGVLTVAHAVWHFAGAT